MGEVFANRYELLDPIAEGGMGAVWRVLDHVDGEVRAAKLLRQVDAGSLLRFMREQSVRIEHRHVVTPLSWVGEDDRVLFTMPLIRGGSVSSLVGDWGALPAEWVTVLLDQALTALEAVHEGGVVHRDVKPANLLLEPTGSDLPHVRLSDFGIAIARDEPRLTTAPGALGTPGYVAPEQRAGDQPDPRHDLYSLATVGLEMLTGHPPPFATEELPATPLAGLLVEARSPDPDRRPVSATEMRARLRDWLPTAWVPGEVTVLDQFDLPEHVPPAGSAARPAAEAPTIVLPGATRPPSRPGRGAAVPSRRPAPAPRDAAAEPVPSPPTGRILLLLGLAVVLLAASAALLLR